MPEQIVTIRFANLRDAVVVCRIGPSGAIRLPMRSGDIYVRIAGLDTDQAANHIADQLGLATGKDLVQVAPGGTLPTKALPTHSWDDVLVGRPQGRAAARFPATEDTALVPINADPNLPVVPPVEDYVILDDRWCLTSQIFVGNPDLPESPIIVVDFSTEDGPFRARPFRRKQHEIPTHPGSMPAHPGPIHDHPGTTPAGSHADAPVSLPRGHDAGAAPHADAGHDHPVPSGNSSNAGRSNDNAGNADSGGKRSEDHRH
jgi:hypothetical protein